MSSTNTLHAEQPRCGEGALTCFTREFSFSKDLDHKKSPRKSRTFGINKWLINRKRVDQFEYFSKRTFPNRRMEEF